MTCRSPYDTDLTDPEWEHLKPLTPAVKPGGRPPIHSRREILNGIFYAVRSGCAWKLLPHDLPPWRTVYHYFWSWRRNGTWQKIHDRIRRSVRLAAGRHAEPSGAVVDSQSVPTTEQGGVRGYDAGKNVSGRKRHVLVDTLGLVLLVVVTAANAQDRAVARIVDYAGYPIPAVACGVGGWRYAGSVLEQWIRGLRSWGKVRLEIVRKPKGQRGFRILPWRWIVERTFAWLGRWRRLKADYECLPETTEALIHIAMIRLMLRRLEPI